MFLVPLITSSFKTKGESEMYYCPDCGERSAKTRGELCTGCAYLESEDRAEYLYTTGEGRNELLGLNELSEDWYADGDDICGDE